MGVRFRRTVTLFPGVRLNLSGSGASLTLGVDGATVNVGKAGVYGTVGAPGTGVSHRTRLDSPTERSRQPTGRRSSDVAIRGEPSPDVVEHFASASADDIESTSLSEFQAECRRRHLALPDLELGLATAKTEYEHLRTQERQARASWLNRTFRGRHLQHLADETELARAAVIKAHEEIEAAFIDLNVSLTPSVSEALAALQEGFEQVRRAQAVWDITARADVSARERSSADTAFDRTAVSLGEGNLKIFRCESSAFQFGNANGADLFMYPGFLAVSQGSTFALVDFSELEVDFSTVKFLEEEVVPTDAAVIGQTWKRVNKDGSPDRRFKDNRRLPVVEYGILDFTSPIGVNERYMVSDVQSAELFSVAFSEFKAVLVDS